MPEQADIIDRIKSGPHWRLLIRPRPYIENRLPLEECLPTVAKATVLFRGWDFPHLNPHERPVTGTNYVASSDHFRGHLEYWRVFTSGQFVYLSGVRESTEPGWKDKLAYGARNRIVAPSQDFDWSQVPGFIDVVNFVYTITEFFEFAARVSQALAQTESIMISVGLLNIRGFVLTVDDPRRGWWEYYAADESTLESSWEVPLSELVSSSSDLALVAMRWFLVRFGWTQPNIEAIKSDMEELTKRSR